MTENVYLSKKESTEITQKILSSVFRLKDSASPEFVLLNLKGVTNISTSILGHHLTSTHGALETYSEKEIKFYMEQLASNFKVIKLNNMNGCIEITERGIGFLKKKKTITLRKYIVKIKVSIKGRSPSGYQLPRSKPGYKMRSRETEYKRRGRADFKFKDT